MHSSAFKNVNSYKSGKFWLSDTMYLSLWKAIQRILVASLFKGMQFIFIKKNL